MVLDIGTRLGPYEIIGRLGAGGMGQVFKARDTRLDRTVAIKISNEAFTAWFEREARAVAALNHPNICQLYDVGPNYLVLEHIVGAPVLPTDNVRKLLDIAVQIADGIAAAHEAGFVHRDLKPSNLLVTAEGRVKILDFGLVKSVAPQAQPNDEPALTVTAHGLVAGTTAYMSPEQARGEATLDARSDQFSYGLVLYELATGSRPFDRATGIETLAAIVRDDPDPLPPKIPAPLRWIIGRCLAKEPRDRYASTRDLYLELKNVQAHFADASATDQQVALTGVPARRRRWWGVAAFAGGAALTVAVALALGVRAPREDPELRFTPFSFEQGGQIAPVWSPDGRSVAFAARQRQTERYQVWVRDLDTPVARPITNGAVDATTVQWTTAGRIIFTTQPGNVLWSILPVGGEPERLLELPTDIVDVSRDGSSVAYVEFDESGLYGIQVRSPPTAEPQRYDPAPFAARVISNRPQLRFSPDGTQLLLMWSSTDEEAWLMPYPADPEIPPRRVLESLMSPVSLTPQFSWLPDNRHIVLSARRESTQPAYLFAADTRSGEFRTVWRGLTSLVTPDVSPDGSQLIAAEIVVDHDIVSLSLDDAVVTPLLATARNEETPAWAAREPAMVYVTDRTGSQEIWLHQPGEVDRPLVTASHFSDATQVLFAPSLAPDGSRVIYFRIGVVTAGLYISAVAGGSPVRLVDGDRQYPGSWSPDGKWYVYTERTTERTTLKKVRTSAGSEPETLKTDIAISPVVPTWSPRGDWILYPDNGMKLISPDGDAVRDLGPRALCAFAPDELHLYCIRAPTESERRRLLYVGLDGKIERDIGPVPDENTPSASGAPGLRLTLTPDGTSVTYSVQRSAANLWLLDGLDTVPLP